jgi:hypothetical protein
MFTMALFTIVKICNQPRCQLVEECTKKLRYVYTMEYYSATKKTEVIPSLPVTFEGLGFYISI